MHGAIERRTDRTPRVAADLLIELKHEGFDEPFEADAVDLGLGGMSMRATYLPDVGQRLRCSFRSPADGTEVEAGCEVVWARDSGPHVGRCGLRFVDVDDDTEQALRDIVASATDVVTTSDSVRDTAPEVDANAAGEAAIERFHAGGTADDADDDEHGHEPSAIELHIDGVPTPIRARVVDRSEGGIRVEQELPFLVLGSGVGAKNGSERRGRIASVDLHIDGDVPKLLVEVAYLDGQLDTLPDMVPGELSSAPPPRDAPAGRRARPIAMPLVDKDAFAAEAPRVAEPPESASFRGEEANDLAMPERFVEGSKVHAARLWASATLTLRAWARFTRTQLEPARKAGLRWFRTVLVARAMPVVGTGARRGLALAWRFLSVLGNRLKGRVARGHGRRQTARPRAASNVAPRMRGREATPRRGDRRRAVIVSGVAFLAAGLLVYALTPGDEPATIPLPASAEAPQAEEPSAEAPEAAETALSAAQAPERAASGAEAFAAGATAEPSPAAEQEAAPPAPNPPALTQEFGADRVPGGRSFMLRMSQAVKGLRGIPMEGGFSVIVPGTLAIDRAGPIASSHSGVERAMILNRGDHAELSVRFAEGQRPSYRVVTRPHAIEVILGK